MRYFRNPSNGYMEASSGSLSWLLAFLWLELYLLAKGNYRHFLIVFFLSAGSIYILALPLRVIYAFMIGKVNAAHYLRQGWIEVADPMQQEPVQQPPAPQVQQVQQTQRAKGKKKTSSSSA